MIMFLDLHHGGCSGGRGGFPPSRGTLPSGMFLGILFITTYCGVGDRFTPLMSVYGGGNKK